MNALGLAFSVIAGAAFAQGVPEPVGYRTEDYRAEVPATLSGATVIGPAEAHALWQKGAAFVDVLPRPPKPANLPAGTVWRDTPRDSIPGALWLPNVGYGEIPEATATYFRRGLLAATKDDRDAPVVIFCLAECWMSWNAAKRAIEWGYGHVHWMPEGTDGWALAGHPLERVTPLEPQP